MRGALRVAFDLSSTRGQKTGIGTYTEKLVRALREYAPEVEIAELDDGVTAKQRTDRRIWREQILVPRLAKQSRADLLHLTGFAAPARASTPVVLTVHDLIGALFPENFPPVSRFYWSRYLPWTLHFATRLIADSEHTKSDIVRLAKISPQRVRVIPLGCDKSFRPIEDRRTLELARARLGLPSEFILFVSTLEPRKGVDTLIEAFAQVANRVSCDLVIVGQRGWYWEKMAALLSSTGTQPRVRFAGYVSAEDLALVYNLAMAFVFPSRYEGFGLPPLEAMACGTPVIGSKASSLPEVVGDAAILVSPDDVAGFARSILQLARDENLRAELRERGLKQAAKFSWERTARETVEVYREVLGERGWGEGMRREGEGE